ncbi:hypothetical protein PVAP13_6NG124100 [Panicum virgatum]|uniref:Uncharacterized protein n=1 Tax=Panicum virgatum TaxID=38727 RepID=A0A8T0QZ27_PANVG|nr:hypothetical protein PVAP13_6NG124100 [Panicum virgatum]
MATSSLRASGSSASIGQGGGPRGYDGLGAPVPYRVAPLAYEPAVMCRCGFKAPRWISWSDENPGHRYYRCRRGKTLLLDLRDAICRLKKENSELQIALRDGLEVLQVKEMNQALEMEIIEKTEELKAKDRKLEELNANLQDMAAKLSSRSICSSFSTVVCVFAVALVVGMLVG